MQEVSGPRNIYSKQPCLAKTLSINKLRAAPVAPVALLYYAVLTDHRPLEGTPVKQGLTRALLGCRAVTQMILASQLALARRTTAECIVCYTEYVRHSKHSFFTE